MKYYGTFYENGKVVKRQISQKRAIEIEAWAESTGYTDIGRN
jgi:hypothetical protein